MQSEKQIIFLKSTTLEVPTVWKRLVRCKFLRDLRQQGDYGTRTRLVIVTPPHIMQLQRASPMERIASQINWNVLDLQKTGWEVGCGGLAVKNNLCDANKMAPAINATLCHEASTESNPQHHFCTDGD